MEVGQTITLIGISRHGKNRVNELGDQWIVDRISDNVICCNDGKAALLISKINKLESRWLSLPTDKNFKIKDQS